jgi:ATP-dependent RNA helicase DeaD
LIALHPDLDRAVKGLGWTEFTPVQERVIPLLRAGRDVLGQAQTGTGKTAAFALPLLERVEPRPWRPFVLVVVPTRELALQVAREFALLGRYRRARVSTVYGGIGYRAQEEALRRGVHVVVGTPGRLLDLAGRGSLDLGGITALVLDEADRLLDLGFAPDIARIIALLPTARQTSLFSATLTAEVRAIARRYTVDPEIVAVNPEEATVASIDQVWVEVLESDRVPALREILARQGVSRTLVFRRTRRGVDGLVRSLRRLGHSAAALHGDMPQRERERVLEGFRTGAIDTLVATNIAARGLHVEAIDHVVNFDLPEDAETYVHRIGRTGRAGLSGIALTFVTEWQYDEFQDLKRRARVPFRQERLALYS